MKRGLLTLLGAVLTLALVAPAFAQDTNYENVDPSGQTVVFWHQHSRDREAALNATASIRDTRRSSGASAQARLAPTRPPPTITTS